MIEQAAIGIGKRRLESNSKCVKCPVLTMLGSSGRVDYYYRMPPCLNPALAPFGRFPKSQRLEITLAATEVRPILTDRRPNPSPNHRERKADG